MEKDSRPIVYILWFGVHTSCKIIYNELVSLGWDKSLDLIEYSQQIHERISLKIRPLELQRPVRTCENLRIKRNTKRRRRFSTKDDKSIHIIIINNKKNVFIYKYIILVFTQLRLNAYVK